jgi:hypothetical protein
MTNAYTVLVVATTSRWDYIIKIDRVVLMFEDVNLIEMSHDKISLQDSLAQLYWFHESGQFPGGRGNKNV